MKREKEGSAMKLAWMGDYRDVVEALIHYCNIYASAYRLEKQEYRGIPYSYAQIQVLEYLLETEDRDEHMSAIASRLGISRSNFTKIVNRLVSKGLVEKRSRPGNRKELLVTVLPQGRALYEAYSQEILRWHFSPMFEELSQIPPDLREHISNALLAAMRGSAFWQRMRANSGGEGSEN